MDYCTAWNEGPVPLSSLCAHPECQCQPDCCSAGSMFQPQQKHSHTGQYNMVNVCPQLTAHPVTEAAGLIWCQAAARYASGNHRPVPGHVQFMMVPDGGGWLICKAGCQMCAPQLWATAVLTDLTDMMTSHMKNQTSTREPTPAGATIAAHPHHHYLGTRS
jgi:hypothetical protein